MPKMTPEEMQQQQQMQPRIKELGQKIQRLRELPAKIPLGRRITSSLLFLLFPPFGLTLAYLNLLYLKNNISIEKYQSLLKHMIEGAKAQIVIRSIFTLLTAAASVTVLLLVSNPFGLLAIPVVLGLLHFSSVIGGYLANAVNEDRLVRPSKKMGIIGIAGRFIFGTTLIFGVTVLASVQFAFETLLTAGVLVFPPITLMATIMGAMLLTAIVISYFCSKNVAESHPELELSPIGVWIFFPTAVICDACDENAPKAALESAARTIGARTSHPNPLHSVYAKAGTGSFFDDTDSEDEDDDNICRSDNEQGGIFTPPAGTSPRTGSSSSVDSVGSGLNLS